MTIRKRTAFSSSTETWHWIFGVADDMLSIAFIIDFLSCLFGCNKLRQKLGWWILLLESCTDAATAAARARERGTFEKFNFSSVNQVSSVVLCSCSRSWLFPSYFFAMIFQSWLVLKAAVTGLGHTVFFLFIGVKEVFMLHNSPICISSVYWPSALKIQPASSKAQNSVLILNEGEEKTLTHTLLYILHLRWHPIRQRSLMWQKLDTFFKKRRPKSE